MIVIIILVKRTKIIFQCSTYFFYSKFTTKNFAPDKIFQISNMKSIVWQFYKKLLLICTSAPLIFVTSSRSSCENTGLYYKHKKKMCSKFTGEYLCQSMISLKLLRNFAEIAIRYRCSPGNLLHIFRTSFYKDTYGGLLLNKAIIKMFQVLCVCLCVCVYVCVCVFIFFYHECFFRLQDV